MKKVDLIFPKGKRMKNVSIVVKLVLYLLSYHQASRPNIPILVYVNFISNDADNHQKKIDIALLPLCNSITPKKKRA